MKHYYLFFRAMTALSFVAVGLISSTVFGQCTVSAGDDFSTCFEGSLQLSGSFSITPELQIDQDENNICMANFTQSQLVQQITAISDELCGAGLTFTGVASGDLTISVYTNLPSLGGVLLAEGTTTVNNSLTGDVTWDPLPTVIGQQYYLVFNSSTITACIGGSLSNPYPGGILYANITDEYPNFDFTFRTYSCVQPTSISWDGPNIEGGMNTMTPTVNPPAGESTYTVTLTNSLYGCSVTDQVVVNRLLSSENSITEAACDAYVLNGEVYTVTGTYTQIFTNSVGCDSILTLNLTINEVSDLTVSVSELSITATNNNATYQWVDCDNGNTPISGAIAQTFTATANGNYAVELTENGCVATSNCVAITTVSTNELSQHVIMVMPNPTKGVFTLKADVTGLSYNLMDSQGRLISSGVTTEYQTAFSIENEADGVYFLRVENEVLKLIKQ